MSLKKYQEELKELIFFRPEGHRTSQLWGTAIPDRLKVYRNNTRSNWTDTLDYDFPLTCRQFKEEEWAALREHYFIKHPPAHWELNQSMTPFIRFLKTQQINPYVKELADYEWHDLKVFIDRSVVGSVAGTTNPTAVVRAYHHQIFFWVEAGAPQQKPPLQKPEVLVFYRDRRNTCHIIEADPLMILLMEHFRKPNAQLADLEPLRRRMLPTNKVALDTVFQALKKTDLIV